MPAMSSARSSPIGARYSPRSGGRRFVQTLHPLDAFYEMGRRAEVDAIYSRMTNALHSFAQEVEREGTLRAVVEEADPEDLDDLGCAP